MKKLIIIAAGLITVNATCIYAQASCVPELLSSNECREPIYQTSHKVNMPIYYTSREVNLYQSNDAGSAVIVEIAAGEQVDIVCSKLIEHPVSGMWAVCYGGELGYVKKALLSKSPSKKLK